MIVPLHKKIDWLEGADRLTVPPSPFADTVGVDLHTPHERKKSSRATMIETILEHETYLYNGDQGVGRVGCHGCSWTADEQLLIGMRRSVTGELYSDETLETLAATHLATELEKAGVRYAGF